MFRHFTAIFMEVFNKESATLASLITFFVSHFQGQISENEDDVLNRCFHSKYKFYDIHLHLWRYRPFRALASLIIHLHSSLFAALLLHPLIPSSCRASLWTTSAHLFLGLPTGLAVWKFPFKTFFGILFFSILIICHSYPILLSLMSSTT